VPRSHRSETRSGTRLQDADMTPAEQMHLPMIRRRDETDPPFERIIHALERGIARGMRTRMRPVPLTGALALCIEVRTPTITQIDVRMDHSLVLDPDEMRRHAVGTTTGRVDEYAARMRTQLMLDVIRRIAAAPTAEPRDLLALSHDDGTIIDALSMAERHDPIHADAPLYASLRDATPLGTGGLCVSVGVVGTSPTPLMDRSPAYAAPGVVDVNHDTFLNTNGEEITVMIVDAYARDFIIAKPDPISRMRMQSAIAERRKERP
jgi:hypothetical protein